MVVKNRRSAYEVDSHVVASVVVVLLSSVCRAVMMKLILPFYFLAVCHEEPLISLTMEAHAVSISARLPHIPCCSCPRTTGGQRPNIDRES